MRRPSDQLGSCASACSSTTIWAGASCCRARGVDLRRDPVGRPLKPSLTKGFSYSDCRVDDARLVALNALDAKERGAEILTRTRCISARREGSWTAVIENV